MTFIKSIGNLKDKVVSMCIIFFVCYSNGLLTLLVLPVQIVWNNRFIGDVGRRCIVTVDGTDYSINQPAPFSKQWYSYTFNGPVIKYEIGVSIQMGHIIWINGPFLGKWNDDTILQRNLKGKLGSGELVEANDGFTSEPAHIELPHEDYSSSTWRKRKANV